VAVTLACGCAPAGTVVELTRWSLVTGSGARRDVTLPRRFSSDEYFDAERIVLETTVESPAAWRGGSVTLALPVFNAPVTLDVDGRRVPVHELGMAHAWLVGGALAPLGARSSLRMVLDPRVQPYVGVAPRLSPTEEGDALFLAVRGFNYDAWFVAECVTGFLTLLYLVVFLLDRRRTEHGWLALMVGLSTPIPIVGLGVPRALLGTFTLASQACFAGAFLAAIGFMRGYLRGRPPSRRWLALIALVLVVPVVPWSSHRQLAEILIAVFLLSASVYLFVLPLRELRGGPKRGSAAILASGFAILIVTIVPDVAASAAGREMFGGFHGMPLGFLAYTLSQAGVLARDHIRSLREVEARVQELETRGREIAALNEELRHQVAERSRELAEALARADGSISPAAFDVGDVFDGRYQVMRALGRGGMGAVYEVERSRDGKRFALKVVTVALSAKNAARFAREAEIGARLRHDNLVSIVDVGVASGRTPYLVMELVRGGSLEDRRGRFGDPAWALPIVRQIAGGLAELHANRIVHRDLKPGNVLVLETSDDAPPLAKISDFGISRYGALADSGDMDVEGPTMSPGARVTSPADLTETGVVMGTPLYMPPEAWLGASRHASADIFSLGVLAYEMLSGRSPFAIPPVLLVRSRQPIPAPPPLAGIDPRVASIIQSCLRVEATARPRAQDVAESLSLEIDAFTSAG
jgi:serine/threonine-protein kinase